MKLNKTSAIPSTSYFAICAKQKEGNLYVGPCGKCDTIESKQIHTDSVLESVKTICPFGFRIHPFQTAAPEAATATAPAFSANHLSLIKFSLIELFLFCIYIIVYRICTQRPSSQQLSSQSASEQKYRNGTRIHLWRRQPIAHFSHHINQYEIKIVETKLSNCSSSIKCAIEEKQKRIH